MFNKDMRKLTYYKKKKLICSFKKSRDSGERDRIRVVLQHEKGRSIDELAEVLMLSRSTIRNYLNDYHKNQKSWNDRRGGSEPRLTVEESQLLNQHLINNTYLKVREICCYARVTFKKKFCRSGMNAWLKNHSFVYKRPKSIPGKLNPQNQEQFIKAYEALKQSLKASEIILFGDAVHPQYQSKAVCGWIKRGEKKTLQSTGKQVKMHMAGAIDLKTMELLIREYKTIDGDAMLDFCHEIERKFKSATAIYLILDNASAGKNKKINEYLKSSRVKIIYLPPYSPNLNPIERVWKIMYEKTVNNCYYVSEKDFFGKTRDVFEHLAGEAKNWVARVNDKFQRIELNPIKIADG